MTDEATSVVLHSGTSESAVMRVPAEENPYFGASLLRLSESESARLMEEMPEEAHDILPTGEVYVSHVHYRRKLNEVFGVGQWALVPRSKRTMEGDTMCREYGLVVRGCFVAESIGQCEYQPTNARMTYADASEGVKSNALVRCCKDLGIASECWDKRFTEQFKAKYCIAVWRADSKKKAPQWRRKDAEPFYDEQGEAKPRQASAHDAPAQQHSVEPEPAMNSAVNPPPTWKEVRKLTCPACGAKPSGAKRESPLRDSKDGSGFYCWKKEGGCGAQLTWDGEKLVDSAVVQPKAETPEPAPKKMPPVAPDEDRAINQGEFDRLSRYATQKGWNAAKILLAAAEIAGHEVKMWRAIPLSALPALYGRIDGSSQVPPDDGDDGSGPTPDEIFG